jgi:hypothetical protein
MPRTSYSGIRSQVNIDDIDWCERDDSRTASDCPACHGRGWLPEGDGLGMEECEECATRSAWDRFERADCALQEAIDTWISAYMSMPCGELDEGQMTFAALIVKADDHLHGRSR